MSELSDNINMVISNNISCQSAMLHAFDIPITSTQLGLMQSVLSGTFRFSFSKEDGKIILGFENTENGNRIVFDYGDTVLDTPKWLGEEFSIVTSDSLNYIDVNNRTNPNLTFVCIISLDSIWITCNSNWILRRNHQTGEDSDLSLLQDYLPTYGNQGYLGGEAIMRANGRITTDTLARVDFKSANMAKTVLGRAGRSRPQGDLIVYFSDDSCAAEGYNSQGDTTLELGPIGGKRQIDAYESNIEEDNIMGVKFNYPFYFKKLFSSKEGLLTDTDVDIKLSKLSYGVTLHGKPYVKVVMPHMSVEFVLQSDDGIFIPEDLEMPELKLSSETPVRRTRSRRVEVVEETETATRDDLELDNIPERHRENVLTWFDAYIESSPTTKEDIDVDISKWFTSYMMKCAREGVAITVSDRDAYREVTNLVN